MKPLLNISGWLVLLTAIWTIWVQGGFEPIAERRERALAQLPDDVRRPVEGLLHRANNPPPQAFNVALQPQEAIALRTALAQADQIAREPLTKAYHDHDKKFMVAYGALFVCTALWAGLSAVAWSGAAGWKKIVLWLAVALGVLSMAGPIADYCEYLGCQRMIDDVAAITVATLRETHLAYLWKSAGVILGLVALLLVLGVRLMVWGARLVGWLMTLHPPPGLRVSWDLLVEAHRLAMKARFVVLAGLVWALLLGTAAGRDIVRAVATGGWDAEAAKFFANANTAMRYVVPPDLVRLGWFAVATLWLSATCWGWSRLALVLRFNPPPVTCDPGSLAPQVDRLRRGLPIYYACAPLVIAAGAFAAAPLPGAEQGTHLTVRLLCSTIPALFIFFLLPLLLVVIRADAEPPRESFGPLSWTLSGYFVLALIHALLRWRDLGSIAAVPALLVLVALLVFGRGWMRGVWLLPLGLLATALFSTAKFQAAILVPLGTLVVMAMAAGRLRADIARIDTLQAVPMRTTGALWDELTNAEKRGPLQQLLKFTVWLTAVQGAIFVALWLPSGFLPGVAGSGAVLALGLGFWATAGSALVIGTHAARFPVLGAALVAAVVFSLWMDNHQIRLVENPASLTAGEVVRVRKEAASDGAATEKPVRPVRDAFLEWARQIDQRAGTDQPQSCIIVATEGGGIRAAFWTATVLAQLQDAWVAAPGRDPARPDFSDHIFAISGISGGSVGAAFFAALCAERDAGRPFPQPKGGSQDAQEFPMRATAAEMLGRDHLAPSLGALLYPDAVQRFFPVAFLPDRAMAMERSWEDAWQSWQEARQKQPGASTKVNRLHAPFLDLWKGERVWVPRLFLSSALVESGKRVIASPLPVTTGPGGEFIDANDLHAHLRANGPGEGGWQDVPLSAAAHTSARFPLVSPPGRLPSGLRVMDGGYFESSAASTGLDLLNAVVNARDAEPEPKNARQIIFILLRYGQTADHSDHLSSNPRATRLVPVADEGAHKPNHLLNETRSILGTLAAAQSARGSYAIDAIMGRYAAAFGAGRGVQMYSFTHRGASIPLSWTLSARSCRDMQWQLPFVRVPQAPKDESKAHAEERKKNEEMQANNQKAADDVFSLLKGTPLAP